MKIVAFSDPDYFDEVGSYDVLVNPENIQDKKQQQYSSNSDVNGSSSQTVKYKGAGPSDFKVKLFFDGTGIISKEPVDKQLKKLKDIAYAYNGSIHEPNYLKVFWGTQSLFQGRLQRWDIQHTMIDVDGTPKRSELSLTILASESAKKKALEEKRNSSDLTHLRTVKDGDSLPLMCHRIYGDSKFYLKVASFNGLSTVSALTPGDKIAFPAVI
ncbi:MAG: hypothetical protein ABNH00_11005 [Dokdonia sp.]